MSVIEVHGRAERSPTLLGQPLASWTFALRVWIATVVALGAAFWLQLDTPSSAAITVGILAQPQRGQALQKAFWRTIATLIGFVASLCITAVFAQSRDLLVVAYAAWLGACVYVASCYDGNQAYGASLSGYTVALIAILQVDTPQNVFMSGTARLATVVVGLIAVAIVNDVLAAPQLLPKVMSRLRDIEATVDRSVNGVLGGSPMRPDQLRSLLVQITGLRLDVLALSSEGPQGSRQRAAGTSALAALIGTLSAARSVSLLQSAGSGGFPDTEIANGLADLDEAVRGGDPDAVAVLRYRLDVSEQRKLAGREIMALETGRPAERRTRLPIHREKKEARRKALRVFLGVLGAAPVLILSSWPMTSLAFALVGVLASLSAGTSNARRFAKSALIAVPVAAILAGLTEFVILDGNDAFALLAMGIAPSVVAGCLLSRRQATAGVGALLLVFVPVILMPANPQSYDPLSYLTTVSLAAAALVILAISLGSFIPTTDKERRRWMVERLRQDLLDAAAGRVAQTSAEETYLAADRIVQITGFSIGSDMAAERRLRYMLLLLHMIQAAGSAQRALADVRGSTGGELDAAHAALAALEPIAIHQAASALCRAAKDAAEPVRSAVVRSVADLVFLAGALRSHHAELRHLRAGQRS